MATPNPFGLAGLAKLRGNSPANSMARPNPFNLAGLAQLCPDATSRYARILGPPGPQRDYNLMSRGLFARQIRVLLREEGQILNDDLRMGIAALSMVGGCLENLPAERQAGLQLCQDVIRASFGAHPLPVGKLVTAVQIDALQLISGELPVGFPVVPDEKGLVSLHADRWRQWIDQITAADDPVRADANQPSCAPAGANPQPDAGELHPWALGGYLDVDVSNGEASHVLVDGASPPVLEVLLIAAMQPQGSHMRNDVMNLLVLGTTILTSGGSMTHAELRRVINRAGREIMADRLDFSCEMVMKGWDFLSKVWRGNESVDFQRVFHQLQEQVKPISPHLSLLCEQTEYKGLAGIVTTVRAMKRFKDFPWHNLADIIHTTTGVDELKVAADFADYIDGGAGSHWSGWNFALCPQMQGNFKKSKFANLMYAATRLSGGQARFDNLTLPVRPTIDNWVEQYWIQSSSRGGQTDNPDPDHGTGPETGSSTP